ncbi:MAG TPA: BTAD domain-containing putative transcriptional regulator [Solirubrobacteraceae bacterium]|nr:BTAD domain-containing putative transcriptional regulator [Solirubrobacteraceae bacterium]
MDIHVFGPLEASVDKRPVPLGGVKPRALLAMLALNAGSTVSTERLIEGLWGEQPPATATKLVQVYVSQLRKALASAGDGAGIVTRGRGYELRVDRDAVDAGRFELLLARGLPREALALWLGPPLDDVAGEPFAAAEIGRLEEMRLAALELAIERDLDAGRHIDVVGELERLAAAEPLREKLHAQRMLALYRCGRQSEALEAYRQARAALVDAIGVEPGPELRRLHEAILRQDPALEPPPSEAAELPPELDAATPMAGREAELEWLRERWRHARAGAGLLALIAGAHGMGKTRLVAELAGEVHRDRGSVLYATAAGPPEGAIAALAAIRAARRPTLLVLDDLDGAGNELRAALEELRNELVERPVLVVGTIERAEPAGAARADATLHLQPLGADAVLIVARLYAGAREDAPVPVAQLAAASGGIPLRVHRAAADWARAEASRRLGVIADRAANERTGLRALEDELAGGVVELQALDERAGESDAGPGVVACPYKGLAAFDVEDADVFFGRELLVAEMVARLAGAPLMGITGPSGSGKSSALRAGLLAALAAGVLPGSERWALALLRPGDHPLRALEQARAETAPPGRLVIAVDQFEETFTACRHERERTAFVDALVGCARDTRRRTLVIVAVRADFYGRCAAYPELSRLLGANHVLVGPMRRDELRRSIELPARRAGLHVEPELVDALAADLEGEPGALPLLSASLLELWQQRDGRVLRLGEYRRAGGVRGAVARLAEHGYERLDPEQRVVARRILLRLAGEGEGDAVVRRRVPVTELEAEGLAEVLWELADDRLVTIGDGEVEVAHEALLREWPRLRGWLQEDAQGRHLHHQLHGAAREWNDAGRDPDELYRGARLAAALDWSAAHAVELNATERAFLSESRRASERSMRRLHVVLGGVAVLLVLAVVAGLVALAERGAARDQARAADAQRLGARALVESEFDRALLLARQGVVLDDTVQTRGNLLATLVKSPAAIGVIRGGRGRFFSVALSPDGQTLAAGDEFGYLQFFDARTRRRRAIIKPGFGTSTSPDDTGIYSMTYSPDGRHLAVAHEAFSDERLAVLDTRTRRVVSVMSIPSHRAVGRMRYSADGRTLDVVVSDLFEERSDFIRLDVRTGRRLTDPLPVGGAYLTRGAVISSSPVTMTSDGRRLVLPGPQQTIVRDAGTMRVVRRLPFGFDQASQAELSPDDGLLAVAGEDGSLRLLDLRTGVLRVATGPRDEPVERIAFTPDGRSVITANADGAVNVWDARRAAVAETLAGHASAVRSLAVASDGRTLYSASTDGSVIIWDLDGARRLGRPFRAGAANDRNARYALSSDGDLLAVGQDDGAVSVVDARTLVRQREFPVVTPPRVLGIAFVPGTHLLVVGGEDGFLALVDADSGKALRRLRGHELAVSTPGISADGRLMVTAARDQTVRFWSLPDGRSLGSPLRFQRVPYDAQLSPDGRLVAVVIPPDTLELRDVRTRRLVRLLRIAEGVEFTRFSPDGRLVALGSARGTAQVWSTAEWAPVTRVFTGHAGAVTEATISRDNRTLATSSADGSVRLWDIKSEQPVGAPLPGLPGRVSVPVLTPDGTGLFAGYDTGQAFRWDIRPASLIRRACAIAGRRLTRTEWEEFLPGRDYRPAC